MKVFNFFLIYLLPLALFGQDALNVTLISQTDDYNIGARSYNDVWGFEDQNGIEYAILGARNSTLIYDLSDPANPREVANIEGSNSIWRDMKSFGNYIYVTTDSGDDGLLIINMDNAPEEITWNFWKPVLSAAGDAQVLGQCHNLYIDEKGFCYLSGCNLGNGGVLMFDLNSNPEIPTFLGQVDQIYSHDVYVRGDTLYSSNVSDGYFSVYDVSNKSNPQFLGAQETSSTFTHNAWLSDDGKFLYTTDEVSGAYVDAYDISDLDNIERVFTYRPLATEGTGVIPHNVHYYNGFLVISYYSAGLKIVDAQRPANLIEVGSYDTSEKIGSGDGCWGAFPFLASGKVLASDMDNGLFVFDVNYQRACYLEGKVTDAISGSPLIGVDVKINSRNINKAKTVPDGIYRTGQIDAGVYEVSFAKSGYVTKRVEVSLENGVLTELDVSLEPAVKYSISGKIRNEMTGEAIQGMVQIVGELDSYVLFADENGTFDVSELDRGSYQITAGAWGYQYKTLSAFKINANQSLDIELVPGFEDDFVFDYGWQSIGENRGAWTREVPIGTIVENEEANPFFDIENDIGDLCFITGNGEGSAGRFDVDQGTVTLLSPVMDLTSIDSPVLSYWKWFYNGGGSRALDDSLTIAISNGTEEVLLEVIRENAGAWTLSSFILEDYIAITNTMQLIVQTSDIAPANHIVEAGLDGFKVESSLASNTGSGYLPSAKVASFPNPFSEQLIIDYELPQLEGPAVFRFYNQFGQSLLQRNIQDRIGRIFINENLPAGVYYLNLTNPGMQQLTRKVIKIE